MAASNTMNFGPEWMRRFPKTPTSDNNRSTSPTLLSSNVSANATTTASNNSGSASNNINNTANSTFNVNNVSGTSTFSWSSVAAANSNTLNRSLQHETSEKSDVPGSNDSALNPFKYSKEFMIKLYKPVGLPLEFERHEYITSEEPLQPMALIVPTEQEQKLLSGASVNSDLTRRIVSNTTGGVITGGERVERDRVLYSPRNDKHINTGLTSPRGERFGGIIGGVLSGRTSPRSSRPSRTPGSLNPSSDDPIWNGVVTRNAVGTFDSNGVFRIQGNHVDEESFDKSKKEDSEPNKKIDQELEKKNQTNRSDTSDYTKSPQSDNITSKKESSMSQNESVNNIEDTADTNLSTEELLQRANQHMQDEQNMMQGWQELQEQSQQDNNNIDMQDEYHPLDEQNEQPPLQQRWQEAEQLSPQQQNHRNSIIKQEKEIEREFERDIDRGQHILEQQLLLQQLQLQEKDKEQQQHEKQQLQRQFHEQEQIQMQQRQEQEQKQIQLQMQLRLQQQHQQQLLLQQQQILQDQQHRQQHIMQQQHHQQLLLQHHFDPDQDDDVLKEAFSYPNIGNLGGSGSTPPLSPTGKTKYSTHPLIGPNSAFSDTNSGVTSLFSGGLNSESRKPEQYKWLYRDPSGNIQGPFSSQEMNEWYKGGFFVLSLLVKRVEDAAFEPLGALIRKTGDDDRPFSAPIMGNRPSLTIAMPNNNNSSRLVNDPFQRTWGAPNSPSTAQLFLEHQQRFNPFGGTTSVPTTPFDRYQFGGVFGRNEVSNGWNDLGTTNTTWGPSDNYTSNGGNLSPRLQAPNSPPLFNNNTTFNVSPPQTYLEHQRQIERQQYLMLQQRQLQQQNQHAYPDTFIRQQHQNYVGLSGPVSAPITNTPNSPFIDVITRNSGWSTTAEQQPPPTSPWGIIAPGVGATPSRAQQSEDSGYFNIRKESNFGLQQSTHHERLQPRNNERSYEVVGGQTQEPIYENKAINEVFNEVIESMSKLTPTDEQTNSNKADVKFNNVDKIELSPKSKLEESLPQSTQKEESLRPKPSFREIQAEEERKKLHEEKEKATVIPVVSTNNVAGKLPQPLKPSNSAWMNNSPVTPSSPAPWAKDDDHPTHKTPSLREIQEMETRKAVERKASVVTANSYASAPFKDDTTTSSTTSWGIIVPPSSNESDSSSLSTSPVVTTPAWQSNNTAPKKTFREIQKEEEEAMKKRNKIREMQQQALISSTTTGGTTAQNNMGKRYADTVSVGNSNKSSTNSVNAWTTVANKTSARVTTTPTNLGLNSSSVLPGATKTNIASKETSILDSEHKAINGLRSVNQSARPVETLKSNNKTSVNMGISKPITTNSTNNNSSGNVSEYSTPRPPSEEFLKWCRNALRGLNNVNVDEFIQMLLTFPLDPPPATIEIIQDSIYANSPTLDGRRFADEFIKRRKADANGLPISSLLSHHIDSKLNKDLINGNGTKDDYTGNGAGAFKVVTTKKGKKNKH